MRCPIPVPCTSIDVVMQGQSTKAQDPGAWATGIVEVALPVEYKMKNIEETEAAKRRLLHASRSVTRINFDIAQTGLVWLLVTSKLAVPLFACSANDSSAGTSPSHNPAYERAVWLSTEQLACILRVRFTRHSQLPGVSL